MVLAAGTSERMGGRNKLLLPIDGVPLIVRVVDTLLASRAWPVVVVTGHEADRVEAVLLGKDVRPVPNPDFVTGLSSSLRAGLDALDPSPDGVLICLGDMPWVTSTEVDALIDAFDPVAGKSICVPVHLGTRGNPVLWSARYFEALRSVRGDIGARRLLAEYPDAVHEVAVVGDGVLRDVDTPQALGRDES